MYQLIWSKSNAILCLSCGGQQIKFLFPSFSFFFFGPGCLSTYCSFLCLPLYQNSLKVIKFIVT